MVASSRGSDVQSFWVEIRSPKRKSLVDRSNFGEPFECPKVKKNGPQTPCHQSKSK